MADADIITLEYDDGIEQECEVMGVFDVDGKEYIALLPQDDSDDVYIYGFKQIDDEDYELVELDEEEFNRATAEFDRLMLEEEEEQ